MALNGKKQHIRRKDFLVFAGTAGIPKKSAEAMINRLIGYLPKWRELCQDSLLLVEQKDQLIDLIEERIKRISN